MKLKKRNDKEEKKVAVKAKVAPKKAKKASLATICTEVAMDNPKVSYNTLCKKAEEAFKVRGTLSFLIQNAMNDALDSLAVE